MSENRDDPAALARLVPEMPLETPLAPDPLRHVGVVEGSPIVSPVGLKLAGSLFLHHVCLGSWFVTLGSYVSANSGDSGNKMFVAGFVGIAYGAPALGAMCSPFVTGLLADHYFAAERLMALLGVLSALAITGAVAATTQTAFFFALFAYFLFFHPSSALATSVAMHHLRQPDRDYPIVRACGTAGWIVAGVFVGWIWPAVTGKKIEGTAVPMVVCAVASLLNAAYSLCMPHTPPVRKQDAAAENSPSRATRWPELFRDRRFLALMLLGVTAHIPSYFYYSYSNVYLNWTGMEHAAAKMTQGQCVEMFVMLAMPLILTRLSVKAAVCIGLTVWSLRFFMLSASASAAGLEQGALLFGAILTHGFAFVLVTISLQLNVDRSAGRFRRSTAQGLFIVASQGIGCFAGAQFAGLAAARLLPAEVSAAQAGGWETFWLLPAFGSAAVLLLALLVLPGDADVPERVKP